MEGLVSVGSPPWLLDGSDVARLCDGRADTSRGTKLNEVAVVRESVLTWQIEAIRSDAGGSENLTVMMELCKSCIKLFQGVDGDISMPYDVTNIKEGADALYHLSGDMSRNGRKIHLHQSL